MSVINFLPASRFANRPVPDGCFVVPDVFIPHLFNEESVQIWFGSRFSAKSATKARELLARCAGKEYFRGIYARQNREDVKNSQFQLFKDIINDRPWLSNQFEVRDSDYVIENTITGNKLIPGSFDNPQKIMSIADPTDIWVEEPITDKGEIKRKDFLSMFGSLRNPHEVPPRFHFTFNPISVDSWIYKDFFDKKTIPANRVLANYGDNPFCPASAYEFFAWLKDVDPDKYDIDALGLWGVPRPDNPYFHRMLANVNSFFGSCQYDAALPVYATLDFNITNSVLIRQKPPGGLRYLEEIHVTGLDLEAVCKELAMRYGRNFIYFSGDASGNARSAYTTGNLSAWKLIRGYMAKYGARFCNYDSVPDSNASTASSCFICNALIQHYAGNLLIDSQKCPTLTADVKRMKRTSDGSLDKDDCKKHNYGHMGDTFRYDLCNFEYTTYKKISNQHTPNN